MRFPNVARWRTLLMLMLLVMFSSVSSFAEDPDMLKYALDESIKAQGATFTVSGDVVIMASDTDPVLFDLRLTVKTDAASAKPMNQYIINHMEVAYFEVKEIEGKTVYAIQFKEDFWESSVQVQDLYPILPKRIIVTPTLFVYDAIEKPIAAKPKLSRKKPKDFEASTYKKVFEPGVPTPVTTSTFFASKDYGFKKPGSSIYGGSSATSSYSTGGGYKPKDSILIKSDLKLSGQAGRYQDVIWELMKMEDKPTMGQFMAALGPLMEISDENPFKKYSGRSLKNAMEEMAEVIVQMEKAYPDAIWYALGRDIYLMGDVLDAFYRTAGQPWRLRRLHASAPSFPKGESEEKLNLIADFLETNGIDIEGIGPNSRPHIIFDITSYGKNTYRYSQSSELMRAAYWRWADLRRDPRDLVRKLNFVSVSHGPKNVMIEPDFEIDRYFRRVKFDDGPEHILRVDAPIEVQYSTTWHGLYGLMERLDDGRVVTKPGAKDSYNQRAKMLWEMWEVAKRVSSPKFMEEVKAQANRYGLKFDSASCNYLLGSDRGLFRSAK